MSDWEIIRIVEDVGAADGDRWLIVYRVAAEFSPNGEYSFSLPKGLLNTYAAAYEYDLDDSAEVDALFDHVMSVPMLKMEDSSPGLARHSSGVQYGASANEVFRAHPGDLKRGVQSRIAEMKRGAAQLKVAPTVRLDIPGMPAAADPAENPKYILKRDMVARLDRAKVAEGVQAYRRERARFSAGQGSERESGGS
jgi:hypothetical protein